jgi:hypothetical protein
VSFGSDSLPFATRFARSTGKCMSVEPDSLLALTFAETSRDLRPSAPPSPRPHAPSPRPRPLRSRATPTPPSSVVARHRTPPPKRGRKRAAPENLHFNPESLHVKTHKRLGSDSLSLPLSLPPSPRPLSLPPSAVRPFRSPKCRSRWYSSTPNTPHISSVAHFVPQVRTALVPTPPHRSEHLLTLSPRFSARRR